MKPELFFIGIKGSGMASLALMCLDLGYDVSGSDIDKHLFTETELVAHHIRIVDFMTTDFHAGMQVVIGNAFDDEFPEVVKARATQGVVCVRYHEFLGHLMQNYTTITVSGSHGKTTTTTMLRDMLSATRSTGYLIGDGHGDLRVDDEFLAVEACEYRRHFLSYYPDIAIITNVEIDHVDYFKNEDDYRHAYEEFAKNVKDVLFICGDDPQARMLQINKKHYFYGVEDHNDIQAVNIVTTVDRAQFDVIIEHEFFGHFDLPLVGHHMILNALAIIAVGHYLQMNVADIELGLQHFNGAARRFVIEERGDNVYIDDYAHHPTEVKVTLLAAKQRFPGRKIIAIFKPHRVSRVQYFADQFAQALMLADAVALCPFSAIDDAETGINIDIHYLQERIPGSIIVDDNLQDAKRLATWGPAVYVFMSSKDIYPLKDKVEAAQVKI